MCEELQIHLDSQARFGMSDDRFAPAVILCQFSPETSKAVGHHPVFLVHCQRLAGAGQHAEGQLTLPEPPTAAVAF